MMKCKKDKRCCRERSGVLPSNTDFLEMSGVGCPPLTNLSHQQHRCVRLLHTHLHMSAFPDFLPGYFLSFHHLYFLPVFLPPSDFLPPHLVRLASYISLSQALIFFLRKQGFTHSWRSFKMCVVRCLCVRNERILASKYPDKWYPGSVSSTVHLYRYVLNSCMRADVFMICMLDTQTAFSQSLLRHDQSKLVRLSAG